MAILIDNQQYLVRRNLYTALLHLRFRDIPRIIWVDAVCINQKDDKEKEHQIQCMVEIYAKASRVIVWLGEAQDHSERALEAIRLAGEKSMEFSDPEPFQQAIRQLLRRPWFHRIWVSKQSCTISVEVTKYYSRFCKKWLQLGIS